MPNGKEKKLENSDTVESIRMQTTNFQCSSSISLSLRDVFCVEREKNYFSVDGLREVSVVYLPSGGEFSGCRFEELISLRIDFLTSKNVFWISKTNTKKNRKENNKKYYLITLL